MAIKKIHLKNFRNHLNREFEFTPNVNLIEGNNGVGKTNVLEAIYILSTGKSFRAVTEKDLINVDYEVALVTGIFDEDMKLELAISKSNTARAKKIYKKNNLVKRAKDFIGVFKSVLFNPEDIRLIIGSPMRRRDYIDDLLCQVYPEYYKYINKYERVLKNRNKLLELNPPNIYSQIEIWDEQLIECVGVISAKRNEFFKYANTHLSNIGNELFGDEFNLALIYRQSLITKDNLFFHLKRDIVTGHTSIGPHREDFDFMLQNKNHTLDLQNFGSRGQQRTAVLALKILEIKYIEDITGVKPTLLLDDIFSELDEHFRQNVLKIAAEYQSIVTSAEPLDTGSTPFHNFSKIDL